MKKIIISTVVATIIYFAWQSIMWMGGFHSGFSSYSSNQDSIMQALNANLDKDGLYFMPTVDPALPDAKAQEEKLMAEKVGKPWAMINYHKSMSGFAASYILTGLLYTLLACLIASLILFHGQFNSFQARFLVGLGLGAFTLTQGILDEMNWWSYPWSFVQPEVIDLTLGWGLCSLWMAWYLKK